MAELRFSSLETHPRRSEILMKWLLRLAVGGAFILIGKSKFGAQSEWVAIFERIGFGQWFRIFTGIVQMCGGLLVLIPRTFAVGILMLACTMVGAMAAWIFFLGVPLAAIMPGIILGGLLLVGGEEVFERISSRGRGGRPLGSPFKKDLF